MKIVFFDDRYNEVYGAQENVLLLAELARENGHDVKFVTTFEGILAEAARKRNLATEIIEAPAALRVFGKGLLKAGAVNKLKSLGLAYRYSADLHRRLKSWKPDVLMASAIRPCLLLKRSRLAWRPKVVLFAQNSVPLGLLAAAALPGVNRVCPISTGSLQSFPNWALKLIKRRVRNLASGRDLSRFHVPIDSRQQGNKLRLLTVCSIDQRKGIHVLLDAMRRLKQDNVAAELTVVGGTLGEESERYLEELKSQVARDTLEVKFVGWQDDVMPFYTSANAFVLASFHEGLPGVLLEAIATGLPCVTTSAGGSADAVIDGKSGWVVSPGDASGLAEKIKSLANEEMRLEFGRMGQQLASEKYSIDAFYQRFANILHELVGDETRTS